MLRRFLATVVLIAVVLLCVRQSRAEAIQLVGLNPVVGNTSFLNIETSPFSVTQIGATGLPSISGLDVQPGTGTLFASGGALDGANLYTLDWNSGTATRVGDTGMDLCPGLAFDLDGTLYGSAAFLGSASNRLIKIDPATGVGQLVGEYGFYQPDPLGFPLRISGLDGIAFDPTTGNLYGGSGRSFDGTPGDIFRINKATGGATLLGSLTQFGTGATLGDTLVGLTFDPSGNLFGSLGHGDGRIIEIDLGTLTFKYLGDAAAGSVSDIAFIPEPSSLALLGMGAVGLIGCGWRRRRRKTWQG